MQHNKDISSPELNLILKKIRREAAKFEQISFHHVSRAFNKRADAIATAASTSVVDGMVAMVDENWDPRA